MDPLFLLYVSILLGTLSLGLPPWGPRDARPGSGMYPVVLGIGAGAALRLADLLFGVLAGRGELAAVVAVLASLAFPLWRSWQDRALRTM